MLAYYREWRMRQRLAPMLYDDADKDAGEAQRSSIVAKAERSPAAVTKQTTGRTEDGLPVHSFRTLLDDLATLTRNTLVTAIAPQQPFTLIARPTPSNNGPATSSASRVPVELAAAAPKPNGARFSRIGEYPVD
jgi:hypothetical protein